MQDGKVRVAVVGIGGRGSWAARQLAQDDRYDLVALCDLDAGKLAHFQQQEGLEQVALAASVEDMLRDAQPEAVVVTTHDAAHAAVAVPCLEAGAYVFVEKPLDVTAAACEALVAADAASGIHAAGGKTTVGMNLRLAPLYATVKRLVADGAVGRVLTIQADEFYDGGRTYFRRWNRLREFGGGLWITKACHDFDLLHWLAARPPRSVHAMARLTHYRPRADAPLHCADCERKLTCPDAHVAVTVQSGIKHKLPPQAPRPDLCLYNSDKDTFDHGIATVEFDDDILATYTCNVVAGFTDRRIRVSGTAGTIDGSLEGKTVLLRRRDPSSAEEVPLEVAGGGHGGGDRALFAEFHEFIRGRRGPHVRPVEAMVAVLMGLAARRSADEGRPVALAEVAPAAHP